VHASAGSYADNASPAITGAWERPYFGLRATPINGIIQGLPSYASRADLACRSIWTRIGPHHLHHPLWEVLRGGMDEFSGDDMGYGYVLYRKRHAADFAAV